MSHDPTDFKCSIIQRVIDTSTQPIGFREAMEGISSGKWAAQVKVVQEAYASGGKDAASAPKKNLPGILFSGTFTKRSSSALVQHSGLICADLDNLGNRVAATKESISADIHVLAAFVSPTGAGLKVVFRCDPAKTHADSYHALEHYVLEHFGLQIDEKCSDVSRICFVSHDPEAFVAHSAEVLPYPENVPVPNSRNAPASIRENTISPVPLTVIDDYNIRGEKDVPEILESYGWTNVRGKYWCRPGKSGEISASWKHFPDTFHVFSDSPETGFPPHQKGFDPFGVYTHLVHHGDTKAAVRTLAKLGYGHQQVSPTPRTQASPPSIQQQNIDRLSPSEDVQKSEASVDIEPFRVTLATKPPEPTTRLFLAGKPIATPGNLVSLISRAKTGKTATVGGVVAAIIGAHFDRHGLDTLGFSAPHTKEAVVLIDTEQSPYDAYTCHKRAFDRAGPQTDVEWFCHYAMVGLTAGKLQKTLPLILAKAKEKHGGVFTLIIDGVADFVNSVNDEAECNALITWLRSIAVEYDCPIICVIHSNEAQKSGDDGRGHLGKQLTRKAESNLLLKKTGEITVITSEKQRKAPITEQDGIAFRWSDEHGRHMLTKEQPAAKGRAGRKPLYDHNKCLECVPSKDSQPQTAGVILKEIHEIPCSMDIRTLKGLMEKWVSTGEVESIPHATLGRVFRRQY